MCACLAVLSMQSSPQRFPPIVWLRIAQSHKLIDEGSPPHVASGCQWHRFGSSTQNRPNLLDSRKLGTIGMHATCRSISHTSLASIPGSRSCLRAPSLAHGARLLAATPRAGGEKSWGEILQNAGNLAKWVSQRGPQLVNCHSNSRPFRSQYPTPSCCQSIPHPIMLPGMFSRRSRILWARLYPLHHLPRNRGSLCNGVRLLERRVMPYLSSLGGVCSAA